MLPLVDPCAVADHPKFFVTLIRKSDLTNITFADLIKSLLVKRANFRILNEIGKIPRAIDYTASCTYT